MSLLGCRLRGLTRGSLLPQESPCHSPARVTFTNHFTCYSFSFKSFLIFLCVAICPVLQTYIPTSLLNSNLSIFRVPCIMIGYCLETRFMLFVFGDNSKVYNFQTLDQRPLSFISQRPLLLFHIFLMTVEKFLSYLSTKRAPHPGSESKAPFQVQCKRALFHWTQLDVGARPRRRSRGGSPPPWGCEGCSAMERTSRTRNPKTSKVCEKSLFY
ncbi:hypothetical protein JCM9140_3961 [Halalkalibacter wakoensis JCM 9140]|uniref:Uncharacterized protein n=1 Tax=Halalkalibacter wakoensis JCM 9140 TaxID=1236970 RepID=W4Q6V8_9BACI|nr:hypothetical protein JCM9140_3961 [Halalkalibacter wakoensis JCM 9140]